MRASDLIGQPARRPDGTTLGRIADILARPTTAGGYQVYAVLVSRRRHLRLFGYERPEITGPWIIAKLSAALQGPIREIPIDDLALPTTDRPK
jgi:hypothetical protein